MNRRVAVTGIGVIASPGRTRNEFWRALANGESSIGPLTLVPEGVLRFSNAAEVPGYRATDYFDEKQADYLDRFAQFSVIAAREAVADAGISITPELAARTAVVTENQRRRAIS
jgi:nodulation protein E